MIALDTNILVRYFVQDGGAQAARATQLIEQELNENEPGFVSVLVICELLWVLRNSYALSKIELKRILELLTEVRQVVVEESARIARAIEAPVPDIIDAIIHEIGQAHGCVRTFTFDRKFARLEGVELLGA